MEVQLELALSSGSGKGSDPNQDCDQRKKRSFEEAFMGVKKKDVDDLHETLPLLIWDGNEEKKQQFDGELLEQKHIPKLAISNNREDNFVVVGWPPVKSWRRQFCHQISHRECTTNYVNVENNGGGGGGGRGSNSMYVKVKMEGVGITRKLNLSVHRSYHSLTAKLIAMFGICEENVEKYKLTYQDKEGHWLLARDVPWETFIHSVQRLKLQKMATTFYS
ncbi:hypothetical protein DH2020_039363 [Rehmannia glutinosa]|uniref:Auxin-responsive protein n=1 Tax=Rehmannia glutinosa TaxID=99300 RepID=A0ABR0UYR5_REHGL